VDYKIISQKNQEQKLLLQKEKQFSEEQSDNGEEKKNQNTINQTNENGVFRRSVQAGIWLAATSAPMK